MATRYETVTRRSRVFAGVDPSLHTDLLAAVRAASQGYRRGDSIIRIGEQVSFFPVVLAGSVQATVPRGANTQIVERFGPGDSFAEAVVVSEGASPVEISALTDARILLIHKERLAASTHPGAAIVHANLMQEMSKKLVHLSVRLNLLAEPRLRSRILMSLDGIAPGDDGEIVLPYSRQDWADYLGVNSKALLRELRRMQDDGLIELAGKTLRVL
ncbi:CRP-like cAMP-binding protein [Leucobacter komagatae]|uniref:CRP-like cAMP-binding protein n=1 Tax=Leucobacter komagatae TaxID=55969 RepID=A0A542Y223_9MICO|nr:Crp/Fnr family transcriptional regulator [Leucobacter komagatae]TQL42132.1 CRP-like cAMP-binding protein [Leucobacter komagatae]